MRSHAHSIHQNVQAAVEERRKKTPTESRPKKHIYSGTIWPGERNFSRLKIVRHTEKLKHLVDSFFVCRLRARKAELVYMPSKQHLSTSISQYPNTHRSVVWRCLSLCTDTLHIIRTITRSVQQQHVDETGETRPTSSVQHSRYHQSVDCCLLAMMVTAWRYCCCNL